MQKYGSSSTRLYCVFANSPGLPDHCIFGAKPLTMLFVFFVFAFCFLCLLDDTNDDLAPKMQ